ncbi:MAG TPA: carboxylesterase family protein [Steroidobacteraceae bacterium]|nr:carboxylesterase family protein [Steroidobacteraceae bacterium]
MKVSTRRVGNVALAVALAIAASASQAASDSAGFGDGAGPIATTRFGDVRGTREADINVFKGIPYGASTSGENRFLPPRDPKPWKGVRNAREYGPSCPQLDPPSPGHSVGPASAARGASEDCQ